MSGKYIEISHPLLNHKLSYLRDKNTDSAQFRRITRDIARLMAYEAFRDWSDLEEVEIETPLAKTSAQRIKGSPVVVSIMRAGNPFLEACLEMIPFASAGHIGIYRDKFINNTVEYYFKLPDNVEGRPIVLCDPLVATGDTMIAALERLENYKVGKIKVLSLLVAKKAIERVHHFFPDVEIYALNQEPELTDKGYLVPGLGDIGDRLFRTCE